MNEGINRFILVLEGKFTIISTNFRMRDAFMRENHVIWRTPCVGLSPRQRYWLTLPGSLTSALKARGEFTLKVIAEGAFRLWGDEAKAIGITPGEKAWVRSVVMSINGAPCVSARSLTPLSASRGSWRNARNCGGAPLGHLLYHSAAISRHHFEWCCLPPRSPLALMSMELLTQSQPSESGRHPIKKEDENAHLEHGTRLLARRSILERHGTPLAISECFLPAHWALPDDEPQARFPPRWSPLKLICGARQKTA